MKQEKKRIRSVWKYHFKTIEICEETDVVFTRCRMCKELHPSTLEYFVKETHKWAKRTIQPICRKCACELQREYKQAYKERKTEQKEVQTNPIETKQETLFDEKESVESKLDRILSFLWLNKWM